MLAAALAMAAACNNLFDLDPGISDRDRDGVPDSEDNCPLDPNPQQRDSDSNDLGDVCDCTISGADVDADGIDDACDDCVGEAIGVDSGNGIDDGCETCPAATGTDTDADGIDDACDPCPGGPPHDEDGDGISDACDNCPTQANADQGPACDRGISGTSRFDGFAEQEPTMWPGVVPGWEWSEDALVITGTTSRATRLELAFPFLVETRARSKTGISLEARTSTSSATCDLDVAQRRVTLTIQFGLGGGLPPPARFAFSNTLASVDNVRLQLRTDPIAVMTVCEALDESGQPIAAAALDDIAQGRLKIASSGESRLDYLWILAP